MQHDLTKTERKRRSRQLALFNSYEAKADQASSTLVAAARRWYARAHQACGWVASDTGYTVSEVAAAAAALSPGTAWSKNLAAAWGLAAGKEPVMRSNHSYGEANYNKARRCLSGADPMEALGTDKARKTKMFYRSLMLEEDAVTDDRWMYDINRLGYKQPTPPKGHHEACWTAVRMLASKLDMKSYQVQALLWMQERTEQEDEKIELDPMQAARNVPLARHVRGAPVKSW